MRNIDKYRGCLIAGAAGDALGYEVEFMREEQIFRKFGSSGINEFRLRNGIAEVSDDTQMTLFTANGLLCGTAEMIKNRSMESYINYIRTMYKCWLKTQTSTFPLNDKSLYSWLLNVPELFSRRAPGLTCLSAVENGCNGSIASPINNSKGCGGIMRTAPVGLYFSSGNYDQDFADILGAESAALTHGHELGYIPAAALVHIIGSIIRNDSDVTDAVNSSTAAMQRLFHGSKAIEYFTDLINKAVSLAGSGTDDLSAIHQLGEGWVAEETLAIAVFCAIRYENDIESALRAAVNHNGDSDSTGAVTGNILGARLGYYAIPQKFKHDLELHDVILEIADDLYNAPDFASFTETEKNLWDSKYIFAAYPDKLS